MDITLDSTSYLDSLVEQIKTIDTKGLTNNVNTDAKIDITESTVYFWTRIFIKEEEPNIEIGDDVTILYTPSGEKLKTKFISYGKEGAYKDRDGIAQFNTDDDKKVLCLMIDEKVVNYNEDIPFIRTLFKIGRHFQYQIVKRDELQFIIEKNNIILDYYDTSF
jgi:hypothetical protein